MFEKTNIFVMGSCLVEDILRCNASKDQKYNIHKFIGSISRNMHPPGKIALRLESEMPKNNLDPGTLRQYKFITKKIDIENFVKTFPKNSVLILDLSYEIINFYFDGDEIFDLTPGNINNLTKFPEWLRMVVNKNTYSYDSGIQELARFQFRNLKKFSKLVSTLDMPVIIMDNFFTKKVYDTKTKMPAVLLPAFNQKFSLWRSKHFNTDLEIFSYNQNMINRFYENVKDYHNSKNIFNFINERPDDLFCDLDHPWGYHPVHLHRACREMLCQKLFKFIEDSIIKYNSIT